MVFGSLIGADVVLAFGAQTTIDREDLRELRDTRWDKHLKPMRRKLGKRQPVLDVRPLLGSGARAPQTYFHWGSAEPRDTRHAMRLDGIPNVHLVPHDALGHDDLASTLRDQGELHRLVLESLQP
jgi:hypothetical protein